MGVMQTKYKRISVVCCDSVSNEAFDNMKIKTILTVLSATFVLTACERASTETTNTPVTEPPTSVGVSTPIASPEPITTQPAAVTAQPVAPPEPIAATKTFETSRLGRAIDTYVMEPTPLNDAAVEKAFADIAVEVAKLRERVEKTIGTDRDEALLKAQNLTDYRNAEGLRFEKAKATATRELNTPVDSRSAAQKIKDGTKDVVNSVEGAAKNTGNAIEHATKKTGEVINDTVH